MTSLFSRKGSVLLHGSVFGAFAAFALFILFTVTLFPSSITPGQAALTFFYQGFLPAELSLMEQDVTRQVEMYALLQALAEHGGYAPENGKISGADDSETEHSETVGEPQDIILWNTEDSFLPWNAEQEIIAAVLPIFPEAKMKGNSLFIGEESSFLFSPGTYSSLAAQRFDLQPFLAMISDLRFTAEELVARCRNERDLVRCTLPPDWKVGSCGTSDIPDTPTSLPEGSRIITFCVPWKTYSVHFALDFTPSGALPIEEIAVQKTERFYEILFPEDPYAEGYTVYATDYADMSQMGDVHEALSTLFTGYIWKSWSFVPEEIRQEPAACSSGDAAEENIPYRCGKELFYHFPFSTFSSKNLAVTATTTRQGQESEVERWVVFNQKADSTDST